MISKNIFTVHEICRLLNQSRKLQNPKVQDEFFSKMKSKKDEGELRSPQMRQSLILFNSGKSINKIDINIAVAKQLIYDLRSIKKRLIDKMDLLDSETKKILKIEIEGLYKLTKGKTKILGIF